MADADKSVLLLSIYLNLTVLNIINHESFRVITPPEPDEQRRQGILQQDNSMLKSAEDSAEAVQQLLMPAALTNANRPVTEVN